MIKTAVIAVAASPTITPVVTGSGQQDHPKQVFLYNIAGAAVFIGGADVTVTTGIQIATGANFGPIELPAGENLFAVAAAGQNLVVMSNRNPS